MSWRSIVVALLLPAFLIVSPASASAAVTATQISTVAYPVGIAEDSAGNVFIADGSNATRANQGLVVVPAVTGTLFGEPVTAGVQELLFSLPGAVGVAISPAGDVYVSTSSGALYVVLQTPKIVFGLPAEAPANTLTLLFGSGAMAGGMEFDAAGNLFGGRSGNGGVVVLPVSSGLIFGQLMRANVINTLNASDLGWTADVAFDAAGNLYITQMFDQAKPAGVYVVPVADGTLYGVTVFENMLAPLAQYPSFGTRHPCGISIDSNDTIFYVSWIQKTVYAMPTTARTVLDQSLSADAFTRLTGANGYADQGVFAESGGDLITGGPSATYRLVAVASYTVTFDANSLSASGSMSPQTSSSAANLTLSAFTLTGFTFAGWSTTPTGAIAYADGATYPFTSSTTLYARWAAPGEVIPVVVRTPPPDVFQSVGISGDDDCAGVNNPELNWAGTIDGGWGKSWAQWPNDGTGGFVCNRVLRYSVDLERWYTVMN